MRQRSIRVTDANCTAHLGVIIALFKTCDSYTRKKLFKMPLLKAKDIAIIGAGPCGLAAAK